MKLKKKFKTYYETTQKRAVGTIEDRIRQLESSQNVDQLGGAMIIDFNIPPPQILEPPDCITVSESDSENLDLS